jgi:hypothetical protein
VNYSYNNLLSAKSIIHVSASFDCKENLEVEISRSKLREEVLDRVKYVKTCVMARELCLLVRTNRAVLEPKDVQDICKYISTLCKEEGCIEPSGLCQKAAVAVGSGNEEKYLELCAQSCIKCGEAKRTTTKKDAYVT